MQNNNYIFSFYLKKIIFLQALCHLTPCVEVAKPVKQDVLLQILNLKSSARIDDAIEHVMRNVG